MRSAWMIFPLFLGLQAAPLVASDSQLIDLSQCEIRRPSSSEPVDPPEWMTRRVEGQKLNLYLLPLEVKILSSNPKGPLCYGQPSVLVDFSVTNKGADPYMLPVSRDSLLLLKPENRRRTQLTVNMDFVGPECCFQAGSSVVTTYAAANVPDSYHMLQPGESARVRAAIRLKDKRDMFLEKGVLAENLSRLAISLAEITGREQPGAKESVSECGVRSINTVSVADLLP